MCDGVTLRLGRMIDREWLICEVGSFSLTFLRTFWEGLGMEGGLFKIRSNWDNVNVNWTPSCS